MKKATNNLSMKQDNRRVVLDCIRRAPVSRAAIAQRVQLTRASVTIITEELINEGLIYEAEMVHSSRGRSPVLLMLSPDSRRFGGVNIKREHIELGITNIAGETLMQQVLPYDGASPETLLKKVCDLLKPHLPELDGIGVCAPGPREPRSTASLATASSCRRASRTRICRRRLPAAASMREMPTRSSICWRCPLVSSGAVRKSRKSRRL